MQPKPRSTARQAIVFLGANLAITVLVPSQVLAQTPQGRRADERQLQQMKEQLAQKAEKMREQIREVAEKQADVSNDPQLMTLHKEFIAKAEKLAAEYERKKQFDKAREVYASLVRLVPGYAVAEENLGRILGSQSVQDRQIATVMASQEWQDSGATLVEGMPVHVEVKGTWKVAYETGPKGIELPEDKKPRDPRIKLGTLIAVIANSQNEIESERPFPLDNGQDFIAKKSGRLFLRMFDLDPSDNDGKMLVLIQSTFGK
jgi:hypothetical protein